MTLINLLYGMTRPPVFPGLGVDFHIVIRYVCNSWTLHVYHLSSCDSVSWHAATMIHADLFIEHMSSTAMIY